MRASRRIGVLALAAALAGCKTPPPAPPPPPPRPPAPAPDLPLTPPTSLEPDLASLPLYDPTSVDPAAVVPPPAGFRALTEEVCRREAARHAPVANLFIHENDIPVDEPAAKKKGEDCGCLGAAGELARELRTYLAAEARNRNAGQALDEFYQLADADGRADLVRASAPVLDQLRGTIKKARAEGLRVPVEPDELDRQRAALIQLLGQADLTARLIDVDLRRRIGLSGRVAERLRPQGPFAVTNDPVDVDAAIRIALERRADLHLLRACYLKLTADTLPTVRDVIRGLTNGVPLNDRAAAAVGLAPGPLARYLMARSKDRGPDPAVLAELAIRREQLHEMVAERERQVADQVRALVATLAAATRQVGMTRWRVEQLQKKAEEAKKDGPIAELPARVEVYRGRSDLVAAVMAWHQARVKLQAAQGVLGAE